MAASCPPNSHADRVEVSGDVKIVHCTCNVGYENRGEQCAKLRAAPRNDSQEITADDLYRTAVEDCQRLTKVRQLLKKKIGQLEAWRGDTRRYQQEYEALRADALRGVYSDALDAVPIESIATRVAASYRAQAQLMSAFDAVSASVSLAEGISEPEDSAKFEKIAEGELATRKTLMEIPLAKESIKTKLWLENLGKVYGTGVKLSAYALEWRRGKPHELSDQAELIGEVTGVWFPEMRVAVASAKLLVRGAQWYTARNSVADLNGVLAQNWNAESYLRGRIRQISNFVAAENQKITTYRAAHPEAGACVAGS